MTGDGVRWIESMTETASFSGFQLSTEHCLFLYIRFHITDTSSIRCGWCDQLCLCVHTVKENGLTY